MRLCTIRRFFQNLDIFLKVKQLDIIFYQRFLMVILKKEKNFFIQHLNQQIFLRMGHSKIENRN